MPRPTQELLNNLRPSSTGSRVTIDDVVVASGGWLVYSLVVATVGWFTAGMFPMSPLLLIGLMFGLIFVDVKIYQSLTPPLGLMALSLGVYGYIVGVFSRYYSIGYDGGGLGLVGSAAAGTIVTAVVVIGMYKVGILKAQTAKFRSMVGAAVIGYGIVVLASLAIQAFGGASLFGDGIFGWALCLFGTTMAALSLTMAAADVDTAIAAGAPSNEATRLAWAFVSTLLWLYLEILRLLARARN